MHGVLTSQSMKVVFKGEDEISLESEIVQECRSFSEFKDLDIHTHGDYFHHYTIQYSTNSIEPKKLCTTNYESSTVIDFNCNKTWIGTGQYVIIFDTTPYLRYYIHVPQTLKFNLRIQK